MDALVCLSPGELTIERRSPPVGTAGDVLVRPVRVGICGTDYHIFEGKHPFLQYPRVMGHELAVEVVESSNGSYVSPGEVCVVNPYLTCGTCIACRNGKRNCCVRISVLGVHQDGGMAGLLSVPAGNLIPAPGLTPDACATVEFLAIGAHAVARARAARGVRCLVVGAGPIGLGVALFASIAGASVTLMDLDRARLAAAQQIVKAATIQAGPGAAEAIAAETAGEGFDIVFDATGNAHSMQQGFDFVAHGGKYVLVSVVKGPISFEDPDFHRREMTLLGSRNATANDFQQVIEAIRKGLVPIERLVTHRTTLPDAVRDIPLWATHKDGLIKALIVM